jgi:hypothetical protein
MSCWGASARDRSGALEPWLVAGGAPSEMEGRERGGDGRDCLLTLVSPNVRASERMRSRIERTRKKGAMAPGPQSDSIAPLSVYRAPN